MYTNKLVNHHGWEICDMFSRNFDSIICFGGEDWWYHNRAHVDMQLMRRFAQWGTTLYINSLVMQKPKLGQGRKFIQKLIRKAISIFTGLKKSDAGFWVYSPFSLPVHHIRWASRCNEILLRFQIEYVKRKLAMKNPIIWVACPAACPTALKLKPGTLVYQRTDRFEEFPGVDQEVISEFDRSLKAKADLTIFVNNTLYQEESKQCSRAFYLDHGVDYELFASADKSPYKPRDIADIPNPIVGFFGGIADHTTDINLIKNVVDLLPEMSFVFVGSVSDEFSTLMESRKNVWILGQKSYEEIPHYGKLFSVAIMPWNQNEWIQACNPIKLKEYLALGKPIISTPFNELNKYRDVVYIAKTAQNFAEAIKKALAEDDPDLISVRRQKVSNTTWDSKAQIVIDTLLSKKQEVNVVAIDEGHQ